MKMKMPNSGSSGNGYYGHEGLISYLSEVESDAGLETIDDEDDDEFSEFMWMENEEEFDKQVLQSLEEEELMKQCIEAMEEEHRQLERLQISAAWSTATNSPGRLMYEGVELCQQLDSLRVDDDLAKQSNLNPDAAEFVPSSKSVTPVSSEIAAKSS